MKMATNVIARQCCCVCRAAWLTVQSVPIQLPGLWIHDGGGGSFLGDRNDYSPPIVSDVKNTWVLPPLPHASFWHGS